MNDRELFRWWMQPSFPALYGVLDGERKALFMLAAFGSCYAECVAKGKGREWATALRSYADLAESSMPTIERRAVTRAAAAMGEGRA